VDRKLDWEKTYRYRAAVVSQVRLEKSEPCPVSETPSVECRATAEVEGDDTPPVQVFAHDVYPPAVPAGLQAVGSGAGQAPFIDLIWSPVTDSDLAGYNVYRSQPGGPSARINSGLVAAPAYRDASAKPGIRYSYSVSAVDVRGNESARSEDASEAVP